MKESFKINNKYTYLSKLPKWGFPYAQINDPVYQYKMNYYGNSATLIIKW